MGSRKKMIAFLFYKNEGSWCNSYRELWLPIWKNIVSRKTSLKFYHNVTFNEKKKHYKELGYRKKGLRQRSTHFRHANNKKIRNSDAKR